MEKLLRKLWLKDTPSNRITFIILCILITAIIATNVFYDGLSNILPMIFAFFIMIAVGWILMKIMS